MRGRMKRLLSGVRNLLTGIEESEGFVSAAPAVPVREVFRRFWPYARPYRRWLPVILVLAALGPAIVAAPSWMYKGLVGQGLVPPGVGVLLLGVLAYVGVF